MNFVENWLTIVYAVILLAFVVFFIYKFVKSPRETQIKAVKEWLKYAVTLAESEFGSGTGQLKLRMVYDMFITTFPKVAKLISFEVFSRYVDEALEWLNNQLENNNYIATLVKGEEKEESV